MHGDEIGTIPAHTALHSDQDSSAWNAGDSMRSESEFLFAPCRRASVRTPTDRTRSVRMRHALGRGGVDLTAHPFAAGSRGRFSEVRDGRSVPTAGRGDLCLGVRGGSGPVEWLVLRPALRPVLRPAWASCDRLEPSCGRSSPRFEVLGLLQSPTATTIGPTDPGGCGQEAASAHSSHSTSSVSVPRLAGSTL